MENYEVIIKIGAGACGAVYLVRSHINGRQYALKKVQINDQKKTRTREALLKEARILAKLKHPHIVVYHDSFFAGTDDFNFMHIVQDYCDGGTLDDKIANMRKKQQYFEEATIMEWFIQIAMAVQYIHSHRILHRDLKAENVFLTKSDGVKLGDFGIAKVLDNTLDAAVTCVGTPCYLSPELCQDIPYSSKSDIWALGCLLFELCALKPAFDASNLISLFYKITKAEYTPLPEQFSEELKLLIAAIMIKDAEDRPSASAILNMTTVRNYLETFIQDREYLLKQKIITLKAKTITRSGGNSPLSYTKGHPSKSEDIPASLSSTVRHSTPVIHSKLLSSLPPFRLSHPAPPSATTRTSPPPVPEPQRNSSKAESPGETEGKTLISPNYSDDFDSTPGSSDSEPIEDADAEIPEEIPEEILAEVEERIAEDYSRLDINGAARDINGSTTADAVSDVDTQKLQELKNLQEGADNITSSYYDDDFEEDSEAEELDEIINKAKEAHMLPPEDEFFADDENTLSPNRQSLRQYLETLGDL